MLNEIWNGTGGAAPLIAVVGPTGSGKSEIALGIAERFNGEVVNCDSLQIYRYFDIGTAKLRPEAMRRIPHRLIDIIDPDQTFTAGEYARRARQVLADITARRRLPVVAGGTGFYLRALLEGLFPGPARNEELRRRLQRRASKRPVSLHRILSRFDPEAARKIHANDIPKLIRALEVCLLTKRPLSALHHEGRDRLTGYRTLKIGLSPDRDVLYEKLDRRCEAMFETGLVEEVRHILGMGYPPESKPFESHGYRQALQMLKGELSLKEAIFYAKRNTRHYAKRQFTWFCQQEKDIEWFRGFGADPELRDAVIERVRRFLENS